MGDDNGEGNINKNDISILITESFIGHGSTLVVRTNDEMTEKNKTKTERKALKKGAAKGALYGDAVVPIAGSYLLFLESCDCLTEQTFSDFCFVLIIGAVVGAGIGLVYGKFKGEKDIKDHTRSRRLEIGGL